MVQPHRLRLETPVQPKKGLAISTALHTWFHAAVWEVADSKAGAWLNEEVQQAPQVARCAFDQMASPERAPVVDSCLHSVARARLLIASRASRAFATGRAVLLCVG